MDNNDIPNNLPRDEQEKKDKNAQFTGSPFSTPIHGAKSDADEHTSEVPTEAKNPKTTKAIDIATKSLAVIGIVALLYFGGVAVAKVAQVGPATLVAAVSNITSVFVPAGNDASISFTLESHNVVHGEEKVLSWRHDTNREGTYFFRYDCTEGVTVKTSTSNEDIACGTSFEIQNTDNTLALVFLSEAKRFVDVPVTITFFTGRNDEATAQASTLLTVTNQDADTTPQQETENGNEDTNTPPSTGSVSRGTERRSDTQVISGSSGNTPIVSNPNGIPDLRVTILATGVVDKNTNVLTPGASVGPSDRAGLTFQIENVGTKASGAWNFIVDLPLVNDKLYVYRPTETQRSLNPGERIEYTLGFDSVDRSKNTVTAVVNVDPARAVGETNRTNNAAEATIRTN